MSNEKTSAPSLDREQVGEASLDLAKTFKQWVRDHEAELNSREYSRIDRALDQFIMDLALRNASPSRECGDRQGANAAYACDTCCDGDCLADNAGLPCPFSVSLRSVDECDPQSFINGVKWARELLAAHSAGAQEPVAWMRDAGEDSISTMAYCCTDAVKQLWLKANPKQVERYTIPLYTQPHPTPDAAELEALKADNARLLDSLTKECNARCEAEDKLDALTDAARDAQDAARYRWLRRGQTFSVVDGLGNDLRADELDAAIDGRIDRAKGE